MDELQQLEKYISGLPKVLHDIIEIWALETVNKLKENSPVRTGFLAASNTYELNETDLIIKNTAPYSAAVENGSKQRWIEPVNKQALRFVGSDGAFWFSKGHEVGPIAPHPFFFSTIEAQLPSLGTLSDSKLQEFGDLVFK